MNTASHPRPFTIRGVIEGFYGPPYSYRERDELIAWMGRHGFNFYLYGPKNDRQHRTRWREPYPAASMARFAATVAVAAAAEVRFCYALAPGLSIRYADPAEFALIQAKFAAFFALGVRDFGLFFDDLAATLADPADQRAFGSLAAAQGDLALRTLAWLRRLDPACSLSVCPQEYHGRPPFGLYLHELGRLLPPEVNLLYTGVEIFAPTICAAELLAFAAATGRPPLLWDNYPVNDLTLRPELHLGPLIGREAAIGQHCCGLLLNPMLQAAASRVALTTAAEFLADPTSYVPEVAWERALLDLVGRDDVAALREFARHCRRSPLEAPEPPLAPLVARALAALQAGEAATGAALGRLREAIAGLDQASYHLKCRMEQLALRAELLPWIEACELWLDIARRAFAVLEALERDGCDERDRDQLEAQLAEGRAHHKYHGAAALEPLAVYALEQIRPR